MFRTSFSPRFLRCGKKRDILRSDTLRPALVQELFRQLFPETDVLQRCSHRIQSIYAQHMCGARMDHRLVSRRHFQRQPPGAVRLDQHRDTHFPDLLQEHFRQTSKLSPGRRHPRPHLSETIQLIPDLIQKYLPIRLHLRSLCQGISICRSLKKVRLVFLYNMCGGSDDDPLSLLYKFPGKAVQGRCLSSRAHGRDH